MQRGSQHACVGTFVARRRLKYLRGPMFVCLLPVSECGVLRAHCSVCIAEASSTIEFVLGFAQHVVAISRFRLLPVGGPSAFVALLAFGAFAALAASSHVVCFVGAPCRRLCRRIDQGNAGPTKLANAE